MRALLRICRNDALFAIHNCLIRIEEGAVWIEGLPGREMNIAITDCDMIVDRSQLDPDSVVIAIDYNRTRLRDSIALMRVLGDRKERP